LGSPADRVNIVPYLCVEVDDTEGLLITAEKAWSPGEERAVAEGDGPARRRRVIKRYTLPPLADVDAITSHLGVDGRLTILIPIRRQRQWRN